MFPSCSGLQFNAHQNYSVLMYRRSVVVWLVVHMARRGKILLKAVLLRPIKKCPKTTLYRLDFLWIFALGMK